MSYLYDASGNRTRITWSDGFFASYEYRPDGLLQRVRENGATVLAEYGYDPLGRRTAMTRGNGTSSTYGYDGLSRLASLAHDLAGTTADIAYGTTFDGLSRISIHTRSNDSYAWTAQVAADRGYTSNVLNQYIQVGPGALGYDGRGNLTSEANAGITYSYDTLGHLTGSSTGAQLAYDALGQLSYTAINGAGITRFGYAGNQMVAEYDASGNITRRHVPSTGNDDPIVSYGPQGRSWLYADERNSIVATADDAGNPTQILSYDEFGIPGGNYPTRFQYTGQAWLPELGMAYYKARIYSPTLGRFMQPDPIGYADGLNLYGYVGADPINGTDPTGLLEDDIVVTGRSRHNDFGFSGLGLWSFVSISQSFNFGGDGGGDADIVVTGKRPERGFKPDPTPRNDTANMMPRRPTGGLFGTSVARAVTRAWIRSMMRKPVQPKLPKGLSNPEIGEIMGWPKGQPKFGPSSAKDIQSAIARIRSNGLSKDYVQSWERFYSDQAFYDVGNDMAAARHLYLRDILRAW